MRTIKRNKNDLSRQLQVDGIPLSRLLTRPNLQFVRTHKEWDDWYEALGIKMNFDNFSKAVKAEKSSNSLKNVEV